MFMLVPAIRGLAVRADDVLRNVSRAIFHPYRRDLHYMRGPGPKWHAKHDPKPKGPVNKGPVNKGPVTRTLDRFAQLHQTMIEVRASRAKLEAEPFRGRYHVSSKNDDDLRIVR